MAQLTDLERKIYSVICSNNGIKARTIADRLGVDRGDVNHYLYASPIIKELCYQDSSYKWRGLIRQTVPHDGLFEFTGYYGRVLDFLSLDEDEWLARMKEGCGNIGRPLSNARGLFHSFRDCRTTMLHLFTDIASLSDLDCSRWEIGFELRIKTSKFLRIYADVIVITEKHVFSLEFKMKDSFTPADVSQAAKYCAYEDLIFGDAYEIVPVLVLTKAKELYGFETVSGTDGEIQVSSGDMLYNAFNEYIGFLRN